MFDPPRQEIDAADLSGTQVWNGTLPAGRPDDHRRLLAICIRLPTDYEPYGFRVRDAADCSCGCKWYLKLQAKPYDWGVCGNSLSPRCGLLTFEHQGCAFFEAKERPAGD